MAVLSTTRLSRSVGHAWLPAQREIEFPDRRRCVRSSMKTTWEMSAGECSSDPGGKRKARSAGRPGMEWPGCRGLECRVVLFGGYGAFAPVFAGLADRQPSDHGVSSHALTPAAVASVIRLDHPTRQGCATGLETLTGHFQPELVKSTEHDQARGRGGSVRHVETFQVGGVRTCITGRPRTPPPR